MCLIYENGYSDRLYIYYLLRKKVVRMNEVLKAVLIGIFTTIVAALNKVGES